jgi:SAM-dependent methyltransferase
MLEEAMTHDPRQTAPAALRNRQPILDVLEAALPERGRILEVASGSGEHIVYFAGYLPHLQWQPSDPSDLARASIDAWVAAEGLRNIGPALRIDARETPWPVAEIDAILCINMVHISPWEATLGLLREAGRLLKVGGLLYLYGPYREARRPFAPSNAAFDADLRRRNPDWGIRLREDVEDAARLQGLRLATRIEMPANNLSLLFRRN